MGWIKNGSYGKEDELGVQIFIKDMDIGVVKPSDSTLLVIPNP